MRPKTCKLLKSESGSKPSLPEPPSHISSPSQSQLTTTDQLPSSLDPNSMRSPLIKPRMSSSSSTPHGADTARSSPQFGMSSVSTSRTTLTSLSPNSMPPSTKPRELISEDTQPLSSTQVVEPPRSTMREIEILKDSRNGSTRTPQPSSKVRLPRRSSE